MQKPLISLPLTSSTPLEIEVRRAGARESLHLVDIVLCDAEGRLILALGNEEAEIFPRSAIKPLQAIPLIEKLLRDGKADIFSDEEISFICASHNGEPHHVTCARSLLNRFSIDEEALICGAHWSLDTDSLIEQVRSLAHPTRAHNNCSGKHSGMLVLAHLEGLPLADYHHLSHPIQQNILGVLEMMIGRDILSFTHGIDGCGAPAYSAPLGNWARGLALFTGDDSLPEIRRQACQRINRAIAAAPHMMAGQNRACSAVNQCYGTEITVKTGAEGVFAAAFHELGLGLMLKARDGHKRAAEAALGAVIHALGYPHHPELDRFFRPILKNWEGVEVGDIRCDPRLWTC